jgi:hypothetical protein
MQKDRGCLDCLCAVDPGALIAAVGEMRPRFWTPPPPLKGRKAGGGSGITLRTVDPGALIVAVEEVRPRFRTPPPPPLKGRKAGGLRNPMCAVDLGA